MCKHIMINEIWFDNLFFILVRFSFCAINLIKLGTEEVEEKHSMSDYLNYDLGIVFYEIKCYYVLTLAMIIPKFY